MKENSKETQPNNISLLQDCEQTNFKIGEDALFDFVSAMPGPAHLKEIKTGRYIFSNQSNLEVYSLNQVSEIIGATVQDLDVFMSPYWGKGFADHIDFLDFQVREKQETVVVQQKVFLDKCGLIHIQNMTKTPVLSNNNKVAAILTLSFDLTSKADPLRILEYYKSIYPKKSDALHYFSNHLNIKKFFNEPLTEKELLCMVYMKQNTSYKSIAASLGLGIKTVETHISNIIGKSKKHSVVEVLTFLRNG